MFTELFTKPTLTVTPKVIWEGDTVTLKCQSVGFLGVQLLYEFYKVSSLGQNSRKDTYTIQSAQQIHMGKYRCEAEAEGKRIMKKNSDNVPVTVKECPKATVKVKNEKIPVYVGDTVTMECLIENSFEGWKYRWYKKNQPFMEHQIEWYTHQTYTILSVTQSDSGEYWCNASRNDSPRYAQSRSPLTLTIQECPKATVKVKNEKIPVYVGDTVTLECLIENSFEGWKYRWYKKNQPFMEHQIEGYTQRTYTIQSVTQSDSGQYWCNASRNDSPRYAQSRSPLSLTIQGSPLTAALVSIGLVLLLLVLLLLLFVYHKTKGETKQKESDVSTPGEGGIKMDSLNKEEENSSMVYSELVYLPDDKKKGNSTAESSTEVVYSDLVIEKLKKKKPDDTAAKFNNAVFSNAVQEKVQKKKKYFTFSPYLEGQGYFHFIYEHVCCLSWFQCMRGFSI
ncbi:FCRL5 protein, partial [Polypterus senegalus]|nr:FCRL5 protein [Polypterus senegalus]